MLILLHLVVTGGFIYKISPSSLNLFEECPRCFWLQVVKKIPRPAGAFSSLPSGVDKLLKGRFDSFMIHGMLPPELEREGIRCKLFEDQDLLAVWRNNLKGIAYEDKQSGVVLRGAVDDILQRGSKLIVLDFKTRGFALKEDTARHHQDQLNVYNFLLRKNGYDTEDFAYLLFYIPEKINGSGDFLFYTKLVRMKVNVKHAENLFRKAIKVLQGEMPSVSENCEFCKRDAALNARGVH